MSGALKDCREWEGVCAEPRTAGEWQMGTEMEQNQNPGQEVERRAGPKDRKSRWDEGLKSGVSGPGNPSLVLGAPLADQRPPPVQAWARVGQGTCSSQSPSLPNPRPQSVDSGAGSPPLAEPPNFAARGAPPGPRPTSLGLSCGGGGAAAGPLSPTLSPGEAAAHNCE